MFKIYGEGERHAHKHGREKRRRWRQLHFAVDSETHEVIAAQMSLENVGCWQEGHPRENVNINYA